MVYEYFSMDQLIYFSLLKEVQIQGKRNLLHKSDHNETLQNKPPPRHSQRMNQV